MKHGNFTLSFWPGKTILRAERVVELFLDESEHEVLEAVTCKVHTQLILLLRKVLFSILSFNHPMT